MSRRRVVPWLLSLALLRAPDVAHALSASPPPPQTPPPLSSASSSSSSKCYNYFAYGSNMASATMTALRGLRPLASSAAVLPDHSLRFNVPGDGLLEPSWASVEPTATGADDGDDRVTANALMRCGAVHGVLYRLTEEDFSRVLGGEGVPFAYRVHRCRVLPYEGDGGEAGKRALLRRDGDDGNAAGRNGEGFRAYTLRAGREGWRTGPDVPPSASYLKVLIRGAREYKLDREYTAELEEMLELRARRGGMAEIMLATAERFSSLRGDRR